MPEQQTNSPLKRDDICPHCKSNKAVTTLYVPRGDYDCPMRFCNSCFKAFPKTKGE